MAVDYIFIADKKGLPRTDQVQRLPDMAFIPNDPMNKDWIEYQVWLKAGNVTKNAVIPDPVDKKRVRDKGYSQDLAILGLYNLAKKSDPTLEFSAYIDMLESLRDNVE